MEPVRGYDEATLPGTIEDCLAGAYAQDGVPMALDTLAKLQACGSEIGVEAEWD